MNQATGEQQSRSGVSPDPVTPVPSSPATAPCPPVPLASSPDQWLSCSVFALLLIATLFAAFPKVLLGIDTFYYRDFGFMCYPQAFYERESFLRGELPLWNPYICCGVPYMAQWGAWYPSYFLNCLLPMPWSANFFQIFHMFCGGCGMFWLLRRWGMSGFACGFGGFAYVFNGVTLSCLMWISYTAFLAWCPWVLGCTMAAWRQGGWWIPLAALASSMQVLAGAPELTVLFWLLVGVLWLANTLRRTDLLGETNPASATARASQDHSALWTVRFWPSLRRLSLVVVLAAGITMVQMLPFWDLLAHSERNRNFGDNTWAIPGWGWANLLVPLFHCYHPALSPWFQPGQHLVCSYYLGSGVLLFAILGAWWKRRGLGMILGSITLVCWLMAMGSNTFIFDSVKHVFPWLGVARYPAKFALFPVLLVPVLAAWAVENSLSKPDIRRLRLVVLVGLALLFVMGGLVWIARLQPLATDDWNATARNALGRAVIAVASIGGVLWLSRLRFGVVRITVQLILCSLLPLDALTHNPGIFPGISSSALVPGIWGLSGKGMPPSLGEGRVMTSPTAELPLNVVSISNSVLHFTSKRLAEAQSLNLLDAVPKVGGAMILHPAEFQQLDRYFYQTPGAQYGEGLLDFLVVAWSSSWNNPLVWTARTNYLPAISAGQRPVFVADERVLSAITAESFNPRQVVYLDQKVRSLVTVTNPTDCRIASTHFQRHRIDVEIEAKEPSIVVISQAYYHLWSAAVDGRTVPLLRANLAFQALQVPAGKHHISLVYRDIYLWVGAGISLGSLSVCGLLVLLSHRQIKRPQSAPPTPDMNKSLQIS